MLSFLLEDQVAVVSWVFIGVVKTKSQEESWSQSTFMIIYEFSELKGHVRAFVLC